MNTVYVATGDGFARLTIDGESWQAATSLRGSGVRCLAVDPEDDQVVYAGSRGRGVWKSIDGGRDWQQLSFPETDVFSLAASSADRAVYAGCEPSKLFVSRDQGRSWVELDALQQIPSAPTWSFPPRPWTSHVRWIAPCPHEAQLLLAGIELGGVMRSDDGGRNWSDHCPGAQRDVHCLAWHPRVPGRAYEAGGGGAAWSHDAGRTWQAADEGRDRHYTWALAVDPDDADCWFVSAAPGPRQAHSDGRDAQAYIYRWRGTGPWQITGLPGPLESFPYALTFCSAGLVAGLRDGRLFLSRDKGESWRQLELAGERLLGVRALAATGPPS